MNTDLQAAKEWLKEELEIYDTAAEHSDSEKMGEKAALIRNLLNHLDQAEGQLVELKAFKAYVHGRLDEAGIATHPNGPHSQAGCRIGDRLDIALSFYGVEDKRADALALTGSE